jgi:hypothetical protein
MMPAQSKPGTPPSQPSPELNALILAEFQYIADATNQSSEDRARVSNYYLVTIGAAIAAIFSDKLNNTTQPSVNIAIGVGFFALALLGLFTLLTLIRLRAGWMAGASAMDAIKEYYARIYDKAQLETAFEWERKDLPAHGKPDSVAFWTAASTIVVDSAMMTLAVIYGSAGWVQKPLDQSLLTYGLIAGGVSLALQLLIYWLQLSPFKK